MALVAEGLSDKEIAFGLGLSTSTVKTYLGRFYRVHGLKNRAQAAAVYVRLQSAGPTHSEQQVASYVRLHPDGVGRLADSRMSDL